MRRLQHGQRVLPRSFERGAFGIADDSAFVPVIEPNNRIRSEYPAVGIPNHIERALVSANRDRFNVVLVVPVNAVRRRDEEDISVAAAKADSLVSLVRIRLFPVNKN